VLARLLSEVRPRAPRKPRRRNREGEPSLTGTPSRSPATTPSIAVPPTLRQRRTAAVAEESSW